MFYQRAIRILSQFLQVIFTFIIMKYYYPALSDKDLGWIRIGGPGLANCMFLAANAYISSKEEMENSLLRHGVNLA